MGMALWAVHVLTVLTAHLDHQLNNQLGHHTDLLHMIDSSFQRR